MSGPEEQIKPLTWDADEVTPAADGFVEISLRDRLLASLEEHENQSNPGSRDLQGPAAVWDDSKPMGGDLSQIAAKSYWKVRARLDSC